MIVSIMSRPVELRVNTISLFPDASNNINMFRCISCGSSVAQYNGKVTKIRPNMEPSEEALVIRKCSKCQELYAFHTSRKETEMTDVVLNEDVHKFSGTMFYCFICRQPLVAFTSEIITDLANHVDHHVPFSLKCVNPWCPANYLFSDIVTGGII